MMPKAALVLAFTLTVPAARSLAGDCSSHHGVTRRTSPDDSLTPGPTAEASGCPMQRGHAGCGMAEDGGHGSRGHSGEGAMRCAHARPEHGCGHVMACEHERGCGHREHAGCGGHEEHGCRHEMACERARGCGHHERAGCRGHEERGCRHEMPRMGHGDCCAHGGGHDRHGCPAMAHPDAHEHDDDANDDEDADDDHDDDEGSELRLPMTGPGFLAPTAA